MCYNTHGIPWFDLQKLMDLEILIPKKKHLKQSIIQILLK